MKLLLTSDQVRKSCDPRLVGNNSADQHDPSQIILSQERTAKALQFGLRMKAEGYNVYVSGKQDTEEFDAIKTFIHNQAKNEQAPEDWCYVMNFKDPYEPAKVRLPGGKGKAFKKDIKNFIQEAIQTLTKAFEHEDFTRRKKLITDKLEKQLDKLFDPVDDRAEKESIRIEETPVEILTIPLKDGKPMTDDEFEALKDEEKEAIRLKQDKYIEEIRVASKEARKLEKAAAEDLQKIEREVASHAISTLLDEIVEKYAATPDVLTYLNNLKEDILNNLIAFLIPEKILPEGSGTTASHTMDRYEVNVLVDNQYVTGAPVVVETNPTYGNLFGRVEKESYMGTWATDLTLIRKGSLHAANGGYLIVRVEELFKNLFSWESLKRAIKNKVIVIEEAGDQWGFITTKTLKPEPIPLQVKIILIGTPSLYHLLYSYDSEFKELYKVKVDFDIAIMRSEKSIQDYVHFCVALGKKEGLLPFHELALTRCIEHGSRLAESQNKLSTRFSKLADMLREANYYATLEKSAQIREEHIQQSIDEKIKRSNLYQDRLNEMIADRQVLIDSTGMRIGQVNALSVVSLGDIDFGVPNKITCTTSIGRDGIVNIDREAEMSGSIHTKGVLILAGYLTEKFVQDKPLSLSAQLVFEQMYTEIDGDSASSSELYTLLSSLAELPIKQGIAVTGSVNQKGEIQAVGGINEKIEGYFDICKLLGSTDEQGVIIPSANKQNLMLKKEIQQAIELNKFRIWTVETIDDGIEILTGVKAGPIAVADTVAYKVAQKLKHYAATLKDYMDDDIK